MVMIAHVPDQVDKNRNMLKSKNKVVEKYYPAEIWGPPQTKS